jgi:hypothetical protein
MSDIITFQNKLFDLPRDIHYALREFGVIQHDKYLLCIGSVNKYYYCKELLTRVILKKIKGHKPKIYRLSTMIYEGLIPLYCKKGWRRYLQDEFK